MRRQHRLPNTLSWSMIDVLAGGLGAMLLLMLLSYLESQRRGIELAQSRQQSLGQSQSLAAAEEELTRQRQTQVQLRDQLAQQRQMGAQRQEQIESLRRQLAKLDADLKQTQALLAQAQADRAEADRLLAQARADQRDTQASAARLEQQLEQRRRELLAQERKLAVLEKDRGAAKELAEQIAQLEADLAKSKDRITALEADVSRWEKKAAEAGLLLAQRERQEKEMALDAQTLRRLLTDQQAVAGQLRRDLQQAASRFAGVDLQGRRVVFLVDRSGSMASVDSRASEPQKWPELCRTVGHVLHSMPEAEKFQLIVFSDDVAYPLGKEGEWLTKTPESGRQVETALLRVAPEGNTNLYAGMAAAFRLKSQGLDTIFLFSDGLPNVGPGLPPNPPPDEPSQSALLGKHLRDQLRTQWNKDGPQVRIHSVGFFYESPNLGAFLWALSRENGGSFVGMSKP